MTKYEYSKLAYINPKELNRVQRLTDFESDVKDEMFSPNGKAIVLDGEYLCLDAYIEKTGAAPSTEGKEVQALDLD